MIARSPAASGLAFFLLHILFPCSSSALDLNRISNVRLLQQGSAAVVEIAGKHAPNFTTFKQAAPRSVIVDVAECGLAGVPGNIEGDGRLIDGISTAQYGRAPHSMSRVVIRLLQEAEYRVTIRGGTLLVHLSPGTGGLLVSAGVPVGPDRQLVRKGQPAPGTDLRDEALSEEFREPVSPPASLELSAPQGSLLVAPARMPEPGPEAEPDVERGPETAFEPLATPAPRPTWSPPAPARMRSTRMPQAAVEPEMEAESHLVGEAVLPAAPRPSKLHPPEPEPVFVAMVTPPKEAAPAAVAEEPVMVAQEWDTGDTDSVPVEVVEGQYEAEDEAEDEAEEMPPPPPPPQEERQPPPPPRAREYSPAEERVEVSSAIKHMTWLGFQQTSESSRVFVKTNEPVRFHVSEEGRNLIVLHLENTSIPLRNNRRFLDTHFFDSTVTMITPREIEGVSRNVRVEIQLKNRVPYSSSQEGNLVYISFQRAQ